MTDKLNRENRGRELAEHFWIAFSVLLFMPYEAGAVAGAGPEAMGGSGFFLTIAGGFFLSWLIIWVVVRLTHKLLGTREAQTVDKRYWAFDKNIPLGLRNLSLLQYLLSFLLAFAGVIYGLFDASAGSNYAMMYCWVLSASLFITAMSYVRRSRKFGFYGGVTLSISVLAYAGISFLLDKYLHTDLLYIAPILILYAAPSYAVVLLALLYWRYKAFLVNDRI